MNFPLRIFDIEFNFLPVFFSIFALDFHGNKNAFWWNWFYEENIMRQYFKVPKLNFSVANYQILIEVQIEFFSHNFRSTFLANHSTRYILLDWTVLISSWNCLVASSVRLVDVNATTMLQIVVLALDTSKRMESLLNVRRIHRILAITWHTTEGDDNVPQFQYTLATERGAPK